MKPYQAGRLSSDSSSSVCRFHVAASRSVRLSNKFPATCVSEPLSASFLLSDSHFQQLAYKLGIQWMCRKCMNHIRQSALHMAKMPHMRNTGEGLVWDYHVEYSDFADWRGQVWKREPCWQFESLSPNHVTSLCPSFSICKMETIVEPMSWDCFVD